MVEKLNKVVHIERQLVQRLGREPNPEEIAEELEITTDEVREILRMSQLPVSLNPIDRQPTAMRTGPRVSVQLHPDLLLGAGCLAAPASKETRMEQRSQVLQLARESCGLAR